MQWDAEPEMTYVVLADHYGSEIQTCNTGGTTMITDSSVSIGLRLSRWANTR